MNSNNIKRICSLLLTVIMILPALGITVAFAEEIYRYDNFESYGEGYTDFTSAGYVEPRNAKVVVDNGNKCLEVADGGRLFYDKRTLEEDAETIVTSVDFKIKDTQTEGAVLGFAGALSQYAKGYVRLIGTDLYFHTSMNEAVSEENKIYSNLEVDKWYNVYIVIDRTAMTRSVYLAGEMLYTSSYTHGSDGGEKDYRRRILLVSNAGSIYYDNIEMYEFSADEYKLQRLKTNSIVQSEKNIGYTDGKYPKSAVDMFKDVFSEVTNLDSLNEAFAVLESRKIDTSSSDGVAAFIEIDVPSTIKADGGVETVITLDAEAKTVALNETDDDVAWEIIDADAEGVSLWGNELIISENAKSGMVKLKALCGEIYAYKTMKINVVTSLSFETFEGYEEGFSSFASEGFKEVKNVTVVEENDNKFISITKTALEKGNICYEDNTIDSNVMATSVDFMIKDTETEGSIIGFAGALSQYAKVYLRVKGTDLYFRTSINDDVVESDKIYSGLETGKWYNAYIIIDKNTMTRSVYLGGEKIYSSKYTHGKDGGEQDYRRRWLGITKSGTIYIDNLGIFELNDSDFECARLNANSFIHNETSIGYSDGKYPQSAVDMLRDAYEEAGNLDSINKAISDFKARQIDTSSDDTETAFVKINTPFTAGVIANSINFVELLAETMAVNMSQTGEEVIWEITESTIPGVCISGNTLEIPTDDVDGEVILKASSGELYAYLPLKVHILRDAQITSFTAGSGKVELFGTISKKINLGAVVTAEGTTINASVPLEIAKDLTFTALMEVGEETQWQDVTLTIEGDELNTFSQDVVFYGVGWEDGIKEVINNCSDVQQTFEMLEKYSLGLEIDEKLFAKHSTIYAGRIANGKPYGDFNALLERVEDIQFVVAFYETVRSDYESFLANNIEFATSAGFNVTALNSLNDADSYQFYAELSKVDIDLEEDTPESICSELNTILDKVIVPEKPSEPIGSGAESTTPNEDEFKVNLVPNDTKVPDNVTPTEIIQFADVKEDYWAADALLYMREKNIMVGDGTSVRPEDKLTRGEFVKILVTAFKLQQGSDNTQFTDGNGKWWAEYAAIATELGIVNGIGDGSFGGDEPVTRQMMAVMIDRLITAQNISLYDQSENVNFTDHNLIDSYASEAVLRLGKKGIVSGIGNGLFAPGLTVKRAEAAQIVYNILKQL